MIEGHLATCVIDRRLQVSLPLGAGGEPCEHADHAIAVLVAAFIHPVVVESREQLAATQRERLLEPILLDASLKLGDVRPHFGFAGETNVVPAGDQVSLAVGPKRPAQGRQRAAQAGASALVEHVWPEARCESRPRVHPSIERQPAKQRAGASARRRLDRGSVELDLQIPQHPDPQHCASVDPFSR